MKTYDATNFHSLSGIESEIATQKMLIRHHKPDAWYTMDEAKEGLRACEEAKRVFIYRAHQSISKNGKVIRR